MELEKRVHQQEFTPEMITSIIRAIELGKSLQKEHPEIADLYEEKPLNEIVTELGISVSRVNMKVAVYFAKNGNPGYFSTGPYTGLITDKSKLEILRKKHKRRGMIEGGRKTGNKTYKERKGIHGISEEEHYRYSYLGGIRGYEQGKGIHAQSSEERKKASHKGVISRGLTLRIEGELHEAYMLSQNPENQYQKGTHKGRPIWEKIAYAINKKYHGGNQIITRGSVEIAVRNYKNKLEQRIS